ncbi:hypothetical protein OMK64_02060 [Cellulomonas fimi]|uniref:hypothetical protein n=1 Tax=Cellulomonas fimi TaxID=1708 RepID=UPI00234D6B36|nr:hypothetical protein [Cellulomonas fimi]MDC7120316.1 hypothetical protein [Cellulomonas fimi]
MSDEKHPSTPADEPAVPADEPSSATSSTPPAGASTHGPRPDVSGDDVAFARLRAADPAAGVEPDTARIRAAVAASVGDASGGTAEETVDVVSVPDELGAARARRSRTRWLAVAAAVAGVAVVGGGGFAAGVAAQGDGGSSADLAAAPAMSLEQPSAARDMASAGAADESAATSKLAWYGGRTVFTAGSGLSDEAGTGTAWAFDAASVFSRETLVRVAAALGVTGEPREEYGAWTVGSTDGTGPSVSMSPDGTGSVSYYDPSKDPWSCVASAPETLDGGSTADGAGTSSSAGAAQVDPGLGPDCQDPDQPAAPTGDAARAKASDLLRALGVDPDAYELEVVADAGSPVVTQVTAYQVVDGQRSGLAWNVSLVGDGVQSLWGSLAPLVELGDYDVVSPRAAVERLGDPRFGASGGIMPLAVDDVARADGAEIAPAPQDAPTVPATPEFGPLAWPVEDVTIESARLGLALTTLPDGAAVLLPTYELSSSDGRTWTVVAVADADLDFTASAR